ncbi:nucleotide-binding alpha-beta plait domain-containing protein [Tanacetum coccineum]
MGSRRTKEDDLSKISTSIFVTNFPEKFSAKDLFSTCKQYGHVVGYFVSQVKRSKAGIEGLALFDSSTQTPPDSNDLKVNSNLPKNQNPKVNGTSFVNVVKGHNDKDSPALVLEDDCVMSKDLSNCEIWFMWEFDDTKCHESFSVILLALLRGFLPIHSSSSRDFIPGKVRELLGRNRRL